MQGTSALLGNAGDAPPTLQQARRAVQDAKDALATEITTQAALEKQRGDTANRASLLHMLLKDRAADVLRAEGDVAKLAADYVALHRELTNRSRA